tara:strand:- start:1257 stop:1718 length:462 start_codon:yes stop_codon:yes gene_type:complete
MKFLHEIEDCIIGIIVGLILIGLSGYYFSLPGWGNLWGFIFIVSAFFTVLDVINTLKDLGGHLLALIALLLNNFIDIVLEVALAGMYLGFSIPYISDFINPFLEDPLYLLIIGIFFVVSSIFWIIASPIIWKDKGNVKLPKASGEVKLPKVKT